MRLIDTLPDEELERLNNLLPWHCFILDGKGRKFGRPASEQKRACAQPITSGATSGPALRRRWTIRELARRARLAEATVQRLEAGGRGSIDA